MTDQLLANESKQDPSITRYIAGVDLGGSSIKVGLLTRGGDIAAHATFTLESREFDYVIGLIVQGVEQLLISQDAKIANLDAIGLCAPGLIDSDQGLVVKAANFPGWVNAPVCPRIQEILGCRAFIENDATAAAAGEWWEASKGRAEPLRNMCLLTLGTGVGGGLVVDGNLVKGMGMAGEIGHVIVDCSDQAKLCGCGQKGCLEKYVGAGGILEYTKECFQLGSSGAKDYEFVLSSTLVPQIKDDTLTCADIFAAAFTAQPDELALHVVRRTSRLLGQSILNLTRIVDTELIVVGGGVSDAGAPFMAAIEAEMKKLWWNIPRSHELKVVQAKLGNLAGFVGAAKIASDRL